MRCRYTFEVSSHLRIGETFPVHFRDYTFSFVADSRATLNHIAAEFVENDRRMWPTVTPIVNGAIKGAIRIPQPRYEDLSGVVRFLEGVLCFYGVDVINVEEPTIEWIPETDDERRSLEISSVSRRPLPPDPSLLPETKFGLLAQSLYAFDTAWHLEPLFNFIRRGIVAVQDETFIDAIYNFYFYLETQFGNGKSKNRDVAAEFCRSKDLLSAIDHTRDNFNYQEHPHREVIYRSFDNRYKSKSSGDIARQIVELRGFLHHYNLNRPQIWHPSDKWLYATDAYFLGETVVPLARQESLKHVFSEVSTKRFLEALGEHRLRPGAV